MKTLLLITFIIIINSQKLLAQEILHTPDTVRLKRNANQTIVTDRAPQAVYAEVFGRSIDFSLNYDRRFSNRLDGWGFSAGLGGASSNEINNNNTYFSIPVSINYLAGKNGKYLEVGAGVSYFNATIDDNQDFYSGGSSIIGTLTIGYRNQPIHGGFMFRAGFNPIIFRNQFVPYYPYVSFGYNF